MVLSGITSVEFLINYLSRNDISTFPYSELSFMKFIKVFRKEFLRDYLDYIFESDSQYSEDGWSSDKLDRSESGVVKYVLSDLGLMHSKRLVDQMVIKSVLVINKFYSNTKVLEFQLITFEEIVSGYINSLNGSDKDKSGSTVENDVLNALTSINLNTEIDYETLEQEIFCQNVNDFQKLFLNSQEKIFNKVFSFQENDRNKTLKRDKIEHKIWKAQGNIYLLEDQELQIIDLQQSQQNKLNEIGQRNTQTAIDLNTIKKIILCNIGLIDASNYVGQFMRIIDFNEKIIELLIPIVFKNKFFQSDPNLMIALLKLAKSLLMDREKRYKFDNVSNQSMIVFEMIQIIMKNVNELVISQIDFNIEVLRNTTVEVIVKLCLQIYHLSLTLDVFQIGTIKWQQDARVDHQLFIITENLSKLPPNIFVNIDKQQFIVINIQELIFTKYQESWLQINDKILDNKPLLDFKLGKLFSNFQNILKESLHSFNTNYLSSLCNSIDKLSNLTQDIQRRHRRMEGYLKQLKNKHNVLFKERNIDSIQRGQNNLNLENNPEVKLFWDNVIEFMLTIIVEQELSSDNIQSSFQSAISIDFKYFDDLMKKQISSKKFINQNSVQIKQNQLILQEVSFTSDNNSKEKFIKNFKSQMKILMTNDQEKEKEYQNDRGEMYE